VLVVSFDEVADITDGHHRVPLTHALDPLAAVPLLDRERLLALSAGCVRRAPFWVASEAL
jgi:hypothetical protein